MFITHDYQCKVCGNIFEAMLAKGEVATCSCGSTQTTKLMSAPLFELKGNDYPSKEYKAQAEARKMAQGQKI
jgi:putative FmdB family regulatory protein|tara:strand:- start:407 stop:622 length:216 start_codon:yes stop_codon:yes gene_type:complete